MVGRLTQPQDTYMERVSRDNKQELDIAVLKNNYQNMSEKIDKLEKNVINGFEEIKMEFKCFRDENDKKYTSKLTEKIVFGLVALITIYFINVLLKSIG